MANNNGYMATIGVDTSGFDTALRDLTRELGQIDRALQNDAQNTTLLSQRYTVLQEAATQTAARLQQLQDAGTAAQQAVPGTVTAMDRAAVGSRMHSSWPTMQRAFKR